MITPEALADYVLSNISDEYEDRVAVAAQICLDAAEILKSKHQHDEHCDDLSRIPIPTSRNTLLSICNHNLYLVSEYTGAESMVSSTMFERS
jgi:hypothetical protein